MKRIRRSRRPAFTFRRNPPLTSTERQLVSELLTLSGLAPGDLDEVLGIVASYVEEHDDADADFIMEQIDEIVAVYASPEAAAVPAPVAAPAPAPVAAPVAAPTYPPEPAELIWEYEEDEEAVRTIAKVWESLVNYADWKPPEEYARAFATMNTVANPKAFLDKRDDGSLPYGGSDFQLRMFREKRSLNPFYSLMLSFARVIYSPIIGYSTADQEKLFRSQGANDRRRGIQENLPQSILRLSKTVGVPYRVQMDLSDTVPTGDNAFSVPLLTGPAMESVGVAFSATSSGNSAAASRNLWVSLYLKEGKEAAQKLADQLNLTGYDVLSVREKKPPKGGEAWGVLRSNASIIRPILSILNISPESSLDLVKWMQRTAKALDPAAYEKGPDESIITLAKSLSVEDAAYVDAYYDHFRKTAKNANLAEKQPTTKAQKASVLPVLRKAVKGLRDFLYYPAIVKETPEFIAAVSSKVPVESSKSVSQGFRMLAQGDSGARIWIPLPWTVGLTENRPYEAFNRIGPAHFGGNAKNGYRRVASRFGENIKTGPQSKRAPAQDQWLVSAADLTPEGLEWAKKATQFSDEYMNVSDYSSNSAPVALAVTYFELRGRGSGTLTERDAQAVANSFEKGRTPLFALAAAIRIAFGGQQMEEPTNPELPYLARSPRIEDKMVRGRDGVSLNVVGLADRDVDYNIIEAASTELVGRTKRLVDEALQDFKAVVKVRESNKFNAPMVTREWRPFDYQKVGIAFALMNDGKAILGDEMGLGKTIQALGFLSVNPNPLNNRPTLPALIICPGSVVTNWVKEASRWLPQLTTVAFESDKPLPKYDILVCSWDMIWRYPQLLMAQGFQSMIADEMHYAKKLKSSNRSKHKFNVSVRELMGRVGGGAVTPDWGDYTNKTAAIILLAKKIPNRILMTGTPFSNANPLEIWPALHIIDPVRFPDLKVFKDRYYPRPAEGADPQEVRRVVQETLAEIAAMTPPFMVRRIKQNVADQTGVGDLVIPGEGRARFGPSKSTTVDYLALSAEQEEYLEVFNDGLEELVRSAQWNQRMDSAVKAALNLDPSQGETLASIVDRINELEIDVDATMGTGLAVMTYQRQFVGELKVPNAAKWVKQKVEREQKPVVVWVYHKNVADAMEAVLKNLKINGKPARYAVIAGAKNTTAKAKGKVVELFQNGDLDVVIGSPSMAEGVTLVRANEALFIEYWWVPGKLVQAEDRIFRVGQKEDVVITTLHAPGTIDDTMSASLDRKNSWLDQMAGSDRYSNDEESTAISKAEEWMVQTILDRLKETIKKSALLPDRITLEDLKDALSEDPKNVEEVYTLTPDYAEGSIFDHPVTLLMDEDEVEVLLGQSRGISYRNDFRRIVETLQEAPDRTMNRLDLLQKLPMAKRAVDSAINELADPYKIVSGYKVPEGVPIGSVREGIVRGFQKAGGVLARDEIASKLKKSVSKDQLAGLVAEGILSLSRKPRVRVNPPRRPGQMVVNGRLPEFTFNTQDSLAWGRRWYPGDPEFAAADGNRRKALANVRKLVNNAIRIQAKKPPPLTYATSALLHYLRLPRAELQRYLPEAFAAYNRLHAYVEMHRKARSRVPEKVVRALKQGHRMLSAFEG